METCGPRITGATLLGGNEVELEVLGMDIFGLGERGKELWDALNTGEVPRDSLVLEAARTADRLNELDNIIQGKGVLELIQSGLISPRVTASPSR